MSRLSFRKPRPTAVAIAASLFVIASMVGGIAYAAKPSTVRSFHATITSCAPKGASPAMLTASVTNDSNSTVNLGSAFFDTTLTSFKNISPTKFTPAIPFTVTTSSGRSWSAFQENDPTYGSGIDKNDLDGIYLVANGSGNYLLPGETVTVTFPTTVGTPASVPFTQAWSVSAWATTPRTTSFTRSGPAPSTTISNSCQAVSMVFGQGPTNTAAGVAISPTVTVRLLDATGNLATGASNGVYLTLNDPCPIIQPPPPVAGGTLTGGGTQQNPVTPSGGVASFPSLLVDKVGTSYCLTANSNLPAVQSSTFSIVPGSAYSAAFVNPDTGNLASGTGRSFTAQVVDSHGNPVSTFSGVMTFDVSNSPPGSLAGVPDCEPVVSSNGKWIATSTGITGAVAGPVTLTATPATGSCPAVPGSTLNSDSTSFSVALGSVSMTFTQQPTSTLAGDPISPVKVQVADGHGNPAPDGTEVDLKIGTDPTSGTAQLSGTSDPGCTPLPNEVCELISGGGGVATFSDLSIDTSASNYQLEADSAGLQPALSGFFDITSFQAGQDGGSVDVGSSGTLTVDGPATIILEPPGVNFGCDTLTGFNPVFDNEQVFTIEPGAGQLTITLDTPDVPTTVENGQIQVDYPLCKSIDQPNGQPIASLLELCTDGQVLGCINEQELKFLPGGHNNLHTVFTIDANDPHGKGP